MELPVYECIYVYICIHIYRGVTSRRGQLNTRILTLVSDFEVLKDGRLLVTVEIYIYIYIYIYFFFFSDFIQA